jgi:hypothetical protein
MHNGRRGAGRGGDRQVLPGLHKRGACHCNGGETPANPHYRSSREWSSPKGTARTSPTIPGQGAAQAHTERWGGHNGHNARRRCQTPCNPCTSSQNRGTSSANPCNRVGNMVPLPKADNSPGSRHHKGLCDMQQMDNTNEPVRRRTHMLTVPRPQPRLDMRGVRARVPREAGSITRQQTTSPNGTNADKRRHINTIPAQESEDGGIGKRGTL